jgi:hypothetical protein
MNPIAKIALALLVSVGGLQSAWGADEATRQQAMEHKFEKAKQYYAECQNVNAEDFEKIRPYLKAFTDAEVMADTMVDPAKFAKLMQIVSDPRVMHVMMKCSTEPVMWDTWMRGLGDPVKMMNAGARFMNPMVYFNWMMAPMNPAMYAPMFQMMNPAYYTTWTNAMMNPTFYQPFFAWMDPNWYTPRIAWMTDPASYQPMFNMFSMTAPVAPGQTLQQPAAPSEKTN